jgi:hypothetical protein
VSATGETKLLGRCKFCGDEFERAATGRPREFCKDAHRLAAWRRPEQPVPLTPELRDLIRTARDRDRRRQLEREQLIEREARAVDRALAGKVA